MDPLTWRYTVVGDAQPEVLASAKLQPGELPLVGFFLSPESWYLLSTRRVVGAYVGQEVTSAAVDVLEDQFGNFKGYGGTDLEVMTLRMVSGVQATLQYETGRAAMAPIYYFGYWGRKYPILDKLKDR